MIAQQKLTTALIRRARPEDAKSVMRIAQEYKFDKSNYQEKGFLVFILSEEEYRKRIENSDYFFVAEHNGEVIGYFYSYDDLFVNRHEKDTAFMKNPQLATFLLNQSKPFMFGVQLAIHPEYSYKGVGKDLMDRLLEELLDKGIPNIFAGILHKPYKNDVSINFCKGIGFDFLDEVKDHEGRTWGVYCIEAEVD